MEENHPATHTIFYNNMTIQYRITQAGNIILNINDKISNEEELYNMIIQSNKTIKEANTINVF